MTDLADSATTRFERTADRVAYVGKAKPDPGKLDKTSATMDIGGSGLKQSSGLVMEEFDRNLQGTKANKIYEEMGNSPIAGAVLLLVVEWMAGAAWSVAPFEPDVADYEADAEFLEQCMDDMSLPWSSMIAEAATDVQFGWSWAHMVYKPRNGQKDRPGDSSKYTDGRWGWRKFSFKSQDSLQRWQFDDGGGVAGWWQRTAEAGLVFLPIERGLLFRTTNRKNNPQGYALLRRAYEPWWKKKRLEEVEGIGHERNLAGIPVVGVPPEILLDPARATEKAAWESVAKDLRADEMAGVVKPNSFDDNGNNEYTIELLSASGTARADIGAAIDRYAREIAMSVLADVILMGHQSGGSIGSSQALAITKDEMLRRSMMGLLQRMADVLNTHEVPRLFRLNGKTDGELPRFEVAPPESTTAQQIIEMLKTLADTGALLWPSKELAEYVQAKTGIPMADIMDEQDEEPEPEPAPAPAPTPDLPDPDDLPDDLDPDDVNPDD